MRPRFAALLLMAALPGVARAASPAEIGSALARATELAAREDCSGALALLDPLVPEVQGQERDAVQGSRLLCLLRVGRLEDGVAAHRELLASAPRNPLVRSYGLLVAAAQGRFAESADQLAQLATDDPKILGGFNSQLWTNLSRALSQSGDYARRDRTGLALARANWQPADGKDVREDLSQDAVRALVAEGKSGEAEPFIADIDQPDTLYEMAMQRRYAALWPAIEARLGDHGARAVDRFAAEKLDQQANAPGDPRVRRDAVQAYLALNRFDDAGALGRQVPIEEGMGEDDYVAASYGVEALVMSGDREGGLARARALAALAGDTAPIAYNARLNLALMLVELGHHGEALDIARAAMRDGAKFYNDFGIAWLRRAEACALQGLGRVEEARTAADSLEGLANVNPAAAIEGMMCVGRNDRAATLAVATLTDPEKADAIIPRMQPAAAKLASVATPIDAMWARLAAMPMVKTAFEKAGRILPRALWPTPGERAVPRLTDASDTV